MRTPSRNGVPADRPRHFCDGGGAGRIASLVPRGGRGSFPGIGTVPHGRPDRPGANGAFCLSGTSRSPRARHPALSPSPPWLFPKLLLRPSPTLLSPSSASRSPSLPASARARPLSGFCPSPPSVRSLLRSPGSHPRSARAPWPAENGRSLAAYLARYGEHGSHLRGLMR